MCRVPQRAWDLWVRKRIAKWEAQDMKGLLSYTDHALNKLPALSEQTSDART